MKIKIEIRNSNKILRSDFEKKSQFNKRSKKIIKRMIYQIAKKHMLILELKNKIKNKSKLYKIINNKNQKSKEYK